jgi:hypothetical protein
VARSPLVEPRSAVDYDDRGVRAMHTVLIELGQILGPYREAIVVVGGAVPYLMLRNANPGHIGTLDIDLDLDPSRLTEGAYAELVETLERAAYERNVDPLKPFQLLRTVDPRDGGQPIPVLLDLLMPRHAKTRPNKPPLVAGLRVQAIDAGEIALTNNVRLDIDGVMPDGRPNRIQLLVASIPALLVMKGYALDGRDKAKDAYDIYFCVRSFPGGPQALAAESTRLLADPIALTGYKKIAAKFRSDGDYGPHTVNKFLGESGGFENMTPEQLRTDAYRQVRAWRSGMQIPE